MSVILKFDFQKRKQIRFSEVNYLNYTKQTQTTQKAPNFACDNYIFPKTKGNKNKPCTHSTPLKLSRKKKEDKLQIENRTATESVINFTLPALTAV